MFVINTTVEVTQQNCAMRCPWRALFYRRHGLARGREGTLLCKGTESRQLSIGNTTSGHVTRTRIGKRNTSRAEWRASVCQQLTQQREEWKCPPPEHAPEQRSVGRQRRGPGAAVWPVTAPHEPKRQPRALMRNYHSSSCGGREILVAWRFLDAVRKRCHIPGTRQWTVAAQVSLRTQPRRAGAVHQVPGDGRLRDGSCFPFPQLHCAVLFHNRSK